MPTVIQTSAMATRHCWKIVAPPQVRPTSTPVKSRYTDGIQSATLTQYQ